MIATKTIAETLKSIVSASFPAVECVTGGSPERATAGKSLPAGLRPPCVLIMAGDGVWTDSTLTKRQRFHLVLVDRMKGTGEARTDAAWAQFDALQALFPPEGTQSGGIVFLPESFRLLECSDSRAAACLTVTASSPA